MQLNVCLPPQLNVCRTKVTLRSTASLIHGPSCITGCLRTGQRGVVAFEKPEAKTTTSCRRVSAPKAHVARRRQAHHAVTCISPRPLINCGCFQPFAVCASFSHHRLAVNLICAFILPVVTATQRQPLDVRTGARHADEQLGGLGSEHCLEERCNQRAK